MTVHARRVSALCHWGGEGVPQRGDPQPLDSCWIFGMGLTADPGSATLHCFPVSRRQSLQRAGVSFLETAALFVAKVVTVSAESPRKSSSR